MTSTPPTSLPGPLPGLADRLRQGPLQAILALHTKATLLAAETETDHARQVEQLAELVRLATLAMERFQIFTIELKVLVFELSERQDKSH
jgi:hypothetical protein